ncbi:DUF1206 domain-containing protein [Egicoccus halophilus]|uniref:DUF1206 domain-containing protein n=1 Tax=Egicoccus halophilus TaxID=1670830 RepID=A0A8J3A5W4_9ACTN|nr:DUF1206 domain-containing protein [Egicoccus halophilus]GGI03960.1 hypothetical protein GCM10011354_06660 [Egicoccus halophilus]
MASATAAGGRRSVDRLARAGFTAKGVLYAVLGVLAVRLAAGSAPEEVDQQGAITLVARQPFGRALVTVLALGLSGYALFRAWQSVRGASARVSSLPGWLARLTFAARAALYGTLAVLAWWEASGQGHGAEGAEESLTALALARPGGRLAVAAVGFGVLVVGVVQLREAWSAAFRDHVDVQALAGRTRRRLEFVGRVGYAARGVVFLLAGGFVGLAAWRHDPEAGVGLDNTLQQVVEAPYGRLLLPLLGVGLVVFGAFCLVEARYLRPVHAD